MANKKTTSHFSNSYSPIVRWSPSFAELPALSVRQPWAWLITSGHKDVENRPRRTHYRGSLLIHAGLSLNSYTEENIDWLNKKFGVRIPMELDTGGIVGIVDVVDCVEHHISRWFNKGNFGWVLANPRRLNFRPCKGALGLFRPIFKI
jgi:ASCH domain